MIYRILRLLPLFVFLAGCSAGWSSVEKASVTYKRDKSYASLEIIAGGFFKGMRRAEIERQLGEADYSPTDGQYYYSSDRSVYVEEQDRKVTVGLVVDYRDENGITTETLQIFRLGPIGE